MSTCLYAWGIFAAIIFWGVLIFATMPQRMHALTCVEAQARTRGSLKYFEASITIAMGGMDIDIALLVWLTRFIEQHCIAKSCSVERGGGLKLFIKSLKEGRNHRSDPSLIKSLLARRVSKPILNVK